MSVMNRIRRQMGALKQDERGLSTVEYVILLVLIAALSVAVWKSLGTTVKERLQDAETEINTNTDVLGKGQGQGAPGG